jgi:proteasome accessory factor B
MVASSDSQARVAASSAAQARVPAEERVFSLVLALVASPQGLTKSELFASVHGYRSRYQRGHTDPALERQFERDKEQVRQLGVPIETLDSPLEPGNNQLTRYRISKSLLQLPEHVQFDAEELTLLRLAAMAWSEGSLGAEARWASMKLASLGSQLESTHLGIAPRLAIPEPAAAPLQRAIDDTRIVQFDYQLPDRDAPLTRTVAPLRLHRDEARWHLIAFDEDRAASRVFLLSRIASEVRVTARAFEASLFDLVGPVLDDLQALRARQRVTVSTRPGSVAEARLALRRDGGDGAVQGDSKVVESDASASVTSTPLAFKSSEFLPGSAFEITTLDPHALAVELASYGDEVCVHAPAETREQVLQLLTAVRDAHAMEQGGD